MGAIWRPLTLFPKHRALLSACTVGKQSIWWSVSPDQVISFWLQCFFFTCFLFFHPKIQPQHAILPLPPSSASSHSPVTYSTNCSILSLLSFLLLPALLHPHYPGITSTELYIVSQIGQKCSYSSRINIFNQRARRQLFAKVVLSQNPQRGTKERHMNSLALLSSKL